MTAVWLCVVVWVVQAQSSDRVLILNSYHPQFEWTARIVAAIQDELTERIPKEQLHVEFMDSRRFIGDEAFADHLVTSLQYKYGGDSKYKPDLIISSDDYALNFLRKHRDQIFGSIPVVFCGVNNDPSVWIDDFTGYTGIVEGDSVVENLDMIMQLHPDVDNIQVLGDTTPLSQALLQKAIEWGESSNSQPEVVIHHTFEYDSLLKHLSSLDQQSAVFITAVHKDQNGRYFSYAQDLPVMNEASTVPIYGMWGALMLGKGITGGWMNDPDVHGSNVAKMAMDVLDLEAAGQPLMPVKEAVYEPIFDHEMLNRFGISESSLPGDTVVLFKPPGFWERYGAWVVTLSSASAIILYLSAQVLRRRRVEMALSQMNEQLEETVKERTKKLVDSNKELKALTSQLERMANTDPLTGMLNRRKGIELMKSMIDQTRPFSLVMLDIDYFKQINDQHGHDVGDQVLVSFCDYLLSLCRSHDHIIRWGGEEFVMILPMQGKHQASEMAERISGRMAEHQFSHGIQLTVSQGVCAYQSSMRSWNELMKLVDKALYQAKHKGRNCVVAI